MELINITLPSSGQLVPVKIDRKNMKTCRLKVYPDRTVILALPMNTPLDWARDFLHEKTTWIDSKIQLFQKTEGYAATTEIRTGYSIRMLGEDMVFVVTQCEKDNVYLEGKTVHICTSEPGNQERVMKLFEKWWRQTAQVILNERVAVWYPIIQKYGIEKPSVTVRKMKTLWGSCSVHRNAVTFNFFLIKAKMPYIDYVVLHELVHFLYPNHSKQFYDFLSNHMPDWKERKIFLDQNVVHGL